MNLSSKTTYLLHCARMLDDLTKHGGKKEEYLFVMNEKMKMKLFAETPSFYAHDPSLFKTIFGIPIKIENVDSTKLDLIYLMKKEDLR